MCRVSFTAVFECTVIVDLFILLDYMFYIMELSLKVHQMMVDRELEYPGMSLYYSNDVDLSFET